MAITPLSLPDSAGTLTLAELAAELNISMTTAYELARKDALPIPALKVGRQFRFSRRALARYLNGEAGQHNDAA